MLLRLLGLCELSNLLLEVGVLLLQLRVLLLDALHRGSVLQRGAELLSHKTGPHTKSRGYRPLATRGCGLQAKARKRRKMDVLESAAGLVLLFVEPNQHCATPQQSVNKE